MNLLARYKSHLTEKASQMGRSERAFALRWQLAPWLQLPVIPLALRSFLRIDNLTLDWVIGLSLVVCLSGVGMVVCWFCLAPLPHGVGERGGAEGFD
ncbi:hypothetical protein WBP07_28200 [Novosphingobium sp. BL-8A]|uniref:hypothetical protein n=1 Tax=Novosphingobium sp. BL-8A TaxID=3127639 RepID=UPI003757CFE0